MIMCGLDRLFVCLWLILVGGVWVCGGFLICFCLVVGVEVLMCCFVGYSFGGLDELGGYMLVFIGVVVFIEMLLNCGYICIDLFQVWLLCWGQVVLDLVVLVVMIGFFGLLLKFVVVLLMCSVMMGMKFVMLLVVV